MVKDDGQRLLYPLHNCKGQARAAMEKCVLLSLNVVYKNSEVLRDLCGQKLVVARQLNDGLLKRLKSVPKDSDALTKISLKMLNREVCLTQMNCYGDLNSLRTLDLVIQTLPGRILELWAG